MTDHIIKAADECGIPISKTFGPMIGACPVGDVLERFYAIARAEALEDAAKACDALKEKALASQDRKHLDDLTNTQIRMVAHLGHGNCAEAIRALKDQP